jgi:hypothetical protein
VPGKKNILPASQTKASGQKKSSGTITSWKKVSTATSFESAPKNAETPIATRQIDIGTIKIAKTLKAIHVSQVQCSSATAHFQISLLRRSNLPSRSPKGHSTVRTIRFLAGDDEGTDL